MVAQQEMIAARVNASMLPNHQGNVVCIMGTVSDIVTSPKPGIKLRSSDGQTVQVFLLQNISASSDVRGKVVSITGRVMANNSIQASNLFVFPEQNVHFDESSHNKALEFIQSYAADYFGEI